MTIIQEFEELHTLGKKEVRSLKPRWPGQGKFKAEVTYVPKHLIMLPSLATIPTKKKKTPSELIDMLAPWHVQLFKGAKLVDEAKGVGTENVILEADVGLHDGDGGAAYHLVVNNQTGRAAANFQVVYAYAETQYYKRTELTWEERTVESDISYHGMWNCPDVFSVLRMHGVETFVSVDAEATTVPPGPQRSDPWELLIGPTGKNPVDNRHSASVPNRLSMQVPTVSPAYRNAPEWRVSVANGGVYTNHFKVTYRWPTEVMVQREYGHGDTLAKLKTRLSGIKLRLDHEDGATLSIGSFTATEPLPEVAIPNHLDAKIDDVNSLVWSFDIVERAGYPAGILTLFCTFEEDRAELVGLLSDNEVSGMSLKVELPLLQSGDKLGYGEPSVNLSIKKVDILGATPGGIAAVAAQIVPSITSLFKRPEAKSGFDAVLAGLFPDHPEQVRNITFKSQRFTVIHARR